MESGCECGAELVRWLAGGEGEGGVTAGRPSIPEMREEKQAFKRVCWYASRKRKTGNFSVCTVLGGYRTMDRAPNVAYRGFSQAVLPGGSSRSSSRPQRRAFRSRDDLLARRPGALRIGAGADDGVLPLLTSPCSWNALSARDELFVLRRAREKYFEGHTTLER